MSDPAPRDEEPRPWWLKAMEPLRSEAAMFNVLLGVIAVAILVIGLKLVISAL